MEQDKNPCTFLRENVLFFPYIKGLHFLFRASWFVTKSNETHNKTPVTFTQGHISLYNSDQHHQFLLGLVELSMFNELNYIKLICCVYFKK